MTFDVIATTPRRQAYRVGSFATYEAAAKRISLLSQILPGWRFRIEKRSIRDLVAH